MSSQIKKQIDVVILVVNYFSAPLIQDLVEQLNRQVLPADSSLSIVCVNNSANTQQDTLLENIRAKSEWPLSIVKNTRNIGFGNAINKGLKDRKFDYACFINPDVSLQENTLLQLLNQALKHPKQGIWGGVTINDDHKPDARHAWREPSLKNTLAWSIGINGWLNSPQWNDGYAHSHDNKIIPYSVDCVSGCCLMISAIAWQSTNGFDPDFFLYSEEMDLCRRARVLGYQPTIVTSSLLKHATIDNEQAPLRIDLIYSAKLQYATKHHTLMYSLIYRVLIIFGASLRALKFLLTKQLTTSKAWAELALRSLFFKERNYLRPHLDI